MKTIHKYSLMPGETALWLPQNAQVLDVHTQQGVPQIWLEVDTSGLHSMRHYVSVPTGGEVPVHATHVGTAHGVDDWMVFHVYEVTS